MIRVLRNAFPPQAEMTLLSDRYPDRDGKH
jgi:hypothetical protein